MIIGSFNDLWAFDLNSNTWNHLCGNESRNIVPNYNVPYPGGLDSHAMVIDSASTYLLVFSGSGYRHKDGSTYLCISSDI